MPYFNGLDLIAHPTALTDVEEDHIRSISLYFLHVSSGATYNLYPVASSTTNDMQSALSLHEL